MRYRREACVTSAGGLGLFFLCSCAKFGEFDSSSESPKRCNSVFKESSQWPPAVLKLIPTSIEEKRNTILCHSIGKTNRKPLIFFLKQDLRLGFSPCARAFDVLNKRSLDGFKPWL